MKRVDSRWVSRLGPAALLVVVTTSAAAQPEPAREQPPAVPDPSAAPPPEVAPPEPAPPEPAPAEAAPAPVPAPATPPPEPVKALLKKLDLKPGGYIQSDARQFIDTEGTQHDLTIRRLRFKLDGSAYKLFNFSTLIDFASSRLVVQNAWVELALRPELALRFGKDTSQFGIERMQPATAYMFVEQSYPTQLAPNRDIGLFARGDVARVVRYTVAVVNGVNDNAVIETDNDDEFEYNALVQLTPLRRSGDYGDLVIGGATTFGRSIGTLADPGLTTLRSGGLVPIVRYTTGADAASTARVDGWRNRVTAHGYYFGGPVGVLAEYVRNSQNVELAGSSTRLVNQAWEVAATVAVTPGDRPAYRGLKPKQPFDPSAGRWGAVELAARYGELRVDPDAFTAGISNPATSVEKARAWTVGVNWYFNEYLKLQVNYERTQFTGGAMGGDRSAENVIETRFQAAI